MYRTSRSTFELEIVVVVLDVELVVVVVGIVVDVEIIVVVETGTVEVVETVVEVGNVDVVGAEQLADKIHLDCEEHPIGLHALIWYNRVDEQPPRPHP